MRRQIEQLLYSIGLSANYVGFEQIAAALELAAAEPELLRMVTKRLYPEIAEQYGSTWKAVEHNIRTMLTFAWSAAPRRLEQMAGHALVHKPTPAQFLAILCHALSEGDACAQGARESRCAPLS